MDSLKRKESPLKKSETAKKKMKKSDVKKPTSAYLYFVSDYRKVLKKKGKEINKVQEVAKLCGIAWKSMTEEEKSPYTEKYQIDRERFLKEKEAEEKKSGKVKDPTKPKRPQSGYFLFLADFRKEMAGKVLEGGEKIPTLAGEKWRDLAADEKKKYELLVEQDKQRYEKEMEEWKKTNPEPPKAVRKAPPKKKPALAPAAAPATSGLPDPEEESSEEDDDDEEDSDDDSDEDDKSDSNDSDSE